MAKKIMQFRYYNDVDGINQPSYLKVKNLRNGTAFEGKLPITQLGIQAIPGTKFYLNNSTSPIIIGATGIYQLDLEGISQITNISFDYNSLYTIATDNSLSLIIDFVYGE